MTGPAPDLWPRCGNRWRDRRTREPRSCEQPAVGIYRIRAGSQHPAPAPAEREGPAGAFCDRPLCGPCARFLMVFCVTNLGELKRTYGSPPHLHGATR